MKKFLFLLALTCFTLQLTANERYVVAIHGLMGDANTMRPVSRYLTASGCMYVFSWTYPSTEGTICSHGRVLTEVLKEIAECRPGEPIDFITHSVGALILRQALNVEDCPEEAKIGRAVLLGPPNQGVKLARESKEVLPVHWALGSKIGCELMTYDPCDIQAIGPFPDTMEVLVIAGCRGNNILFNEPNDGFVAVSETALETPYYFESFRVTHGGLLTHRKALQSARAFLLCGSGDEKNRQTQEKPESANSLK